jgi:hypothetical protein
VRASALGDLLLDLIVSLDGPVAPDTDAFGRAFVGAGVGVVA